MLHKEAIEQVIAVDLIGESSLTVAILGGIGRLYGYLPTLRASPAGIIKRIDVYRQPLGMFRQPFLSLDLPLTERAGVIGTHRALVVCVKIIYQPDALDGIALAIEFL